MRAMEGPPFYREWQGKASQDVINIVIFIIIIINIIIKVMLLIFH